MRAFSRLWAFVLFTAVGAGISPAWSIGLTSPTSTSQAASSVTPPAVLAADNAAPTPAPSTVAAPATGAAAAATTPPSDSSKSPADTTPAAPSAQSAATTSSTPDMGSSDVETFAQAPLLDPRDFGTGDFSGLSVGIAAAILWQWKRLARGRLAAPRHPGHRTRCPRRRYARV